jgi:hypothetical protein
MDFSPINSSIFYFMNILTVLNLLPTLLTVLIVIKFLQNDVKVIQKQQKYKNIQQNLLSQY